MFFLIALFSFVRATPIFHEYCVIGAGPAGLQNAYFLHESKRDYVVFEKFNKTGSFFSYYPRHRSLISVNKRYTGELNEEFNMRHDWNSLLNDDNLKFTSYSDKIFPSADLLYNYLNDFTQRFSLNIQFDSQINRINCIDFEKSHDECTSNGKKAYLQASNQKKCLKYELFNQRDEQFHCKVLIISTGLSLPNAPENLKHAEGYESISTNPKDYEGKTVLILGRGNAAFEVAQSIYGYTNYIHLVSRSRVRNAFSTHYVGDVRAVNNDILDTYQLKTLDGFLDIDLNDVELTKIGHKYYLLPQKSELNQQQSRVGYDKVIRCLGFKFDYSIFNETHMLFTHADGRIKKYPVINSNFESIDWSNLYFSGTIAHSLDFRKSSGGFIHGFRYMIRAQHRLMSYRYHNELWPKTVAPLNALLNFVLKRINEAAGIYQMFSHLVDIIAFDIQNGTFSYIEEFPIKLIDEFKRHTGWQLNKGFVIINFQYGSDFSAPGNDVFRLGRATGSVQDAHKSNFLHPVFYYYDELPPFSTKENILDFATHEHHVLEDFLTFWTDTNQHQLQLRRFFERILDMDLKNYSIDECVEFYFTYDSLPLSCEKYFAN